MAGTVNFYRCIIATFIISSFVYTQTFAFGVLNANGLNNAIRWDAAPQMMDGYERSLDGGLRYSLEGGSYAAFRDMFSWQETPTVEEFKNVIQNSFNAWTVVDPATNLGTDLYFVEDFDTPVSRALSNYVYRGAEIDLFAEFYGNFWSFGEERTVAEAWYYSRTVPGDITLTSGTTGYGGYAMSGVDILLNCNTNALWTLLDFQMILTHEIGHAIGLSDVDVQAGPNGTYIDDNYSSSSPTQTLTNSFADLIDVDNPAASPLQTYYVPNNSSGFDAPGVDILMESDYSKSHFTFDNPLSNDEFAGRQFLYPYVALESPCPSYASYGDFDCNRQVNLADLVTLGENYNISMDRSVSYLYGDTDDNGMINLADLVTLGENYNTTVPIPQPTAVVLLSGGSLAFIRRRN